MALRNILHDGDTTLTKQSRPVTEFNQRLHQLLDDLAETVEDANGLGLAAPQVGVLRRVAVVLDEFETEDGEIEYEIIEMVNPKIVECGGEVTRFEGCLSFPGLHGEIKRSEWVLLQAQDRLGNEFTLEANGMLARAVQHELDHLDGVTIRNNAPALYTEAQIDDMVDKARSEGKDIEGENR